jgi:naphthoate synthase/2-ketocyclohexanecarboxyl-CoA hydrolase
MPDSEWGDWVEVEGFAFEHVRYEQRQRVRGGGVARIVLNRPERMNALTTDMFQAIVDALRDAGRNSRIGAIVITHEGPHFGVGGDLAGGVRFPIPPVDDTIKQCLKPVIAAVRGYVIGAHNHMAYTCDFTIAGESAVFGQNGPRVGSPASGYMVAQSAHVMGMKRGRELWLRCRQLTAQEALEAGLCNTVVQDRLVPAEVDRWCDDLLDLVPYCLAACKQSFEAIDMPLHHSDAFLGMIEPNLFGQLEAREAIQAFTERRKPNYWSEEMVARRKF